MQRILFRGNRKWNLEKSPKASFSRCLKCPKDDGSILGLTVLVLFFFVVASGLVRRASYVDYTKARTEYEALIQENESSGEADDL